VIRGRVEARCFNLKLDAQAATGGARPCRWTCIDIAFTPIAYLMRLSSQRRAPTECAPAEISASGRSEAEDVGQLGDQVTFGRVSGIGVVAGADTELDTRRADTGD
jgi:hypothetical protein